MPGTDKWYALGDEKPLSPFESVAVLKEVESGKTVYIIHFTHSGRNISIATAMDDQVRTLFWYFDVSINSRTLPALTWS